jgi:hypothetical protein
MRRRSVSALLGTFAISTSAFAGWNGSQLIQAIYPQDGTADVLIQQPTYSGSGCSAPSGKYIRLRADHPNYKSIYALLLSAQASGQPVNLFVVNGSCTSGGYSELSLVVLGTIN